eukprot:4205378-Prymnesium_polylepis.1
MGLCITPLCGGSGAWRPNKPPKNVSSSFNYRTMVIRRGWRSDVDGNVRPERDQRERDHTSGSRTHMWPHARRGGV